MGRRATRPLLDPSCVDRPPRSLASEFEKIPVPRSSKLLSSRPEAGIPNISVVKVDEAKGTCAAIERARDGRLVSFSVEALRAA